MFCRAAHGRNILLAWPLVAQSFPNGKASLHERWLNLFYLRGGTIAQTIDLDVPVKAAQVPMFTERERLHSCRNSVDGM